MKRIILTLLASLTLASLAGAQSPDFQAMLVQIDKVTNFQSDYACTVDIVSKKPGKDDEVRQVIFRRRDTDKKFLVLTNLPAVERGQGLLKFGDNLLFYDPNTGETEHKSLKESFAGTGAKNDDFTSSTLQDDYKVVAGESGKAGKIDAWVLTLEARNSSVVVPKMKMWVDKGAVPLVLKTEEYSLAGKLMRTTNYADYKQANGRWIPHKQLFIDNLNVGERTQMTIKDISFAKIPDYMFTEDYLKKASSK